MYQQLHHMWDGESLEGLHKNHHLIPTLIFIFIFNEAGIFNTKDCDQQEWT